MSGSMFSHVFIDISLQNSGFPMCLLTFHLFFFLGAPLASYGTILERFGELLASFWGLLGPLGGLPWSYVAPFGPLWGLLGEMTESG